MIFLFIISLFFVTPTAPGFDLPEGTHTYPFSFQLKHLLPSSFRGTYGKIKYKLEFTVDKPWQFDEKYEVPFTVLRSVDLNVDLYARLPQEKQTTRNIGFFNGGPISLHVHTPHTGCVPGSLLPIQVIVNNNSSTHVDKVKFALLKIVDYISTTANRASRQETIKVLKKQAGGVEKKCEQRYEHSLEIPDLPATDSTSSQIIKIRYEIHVSVIIHGMHKDIEEIIPLTIGTIPLRDDDGARGEQQPPPVVIPPIAPGAIGFMTMPMPMMVSYPPQMPAYPPPPIPALPYPQYPATPPTHPQYCSLPVLPSGAATMSPYPTMAGAAAATPPITPRISLPTAPPFDFTYGSPDSTRSSIRSQHWDTPPSYNDVFGSPSSSMSSSFNSAGAGGGAAATQTPTPAVRQKNAAPVASFS